MYYPRLVETANENRMVHMERPMEIHDQLFPHFWPKMRLSRNAEIAFMADIEGLGIK